jgi:hypothetical protein
LELLKECRLVELDIVLEKLVLERARLASIGSPACSALSKNALYSAMCSTADTTCSISSARAKALLPSGYKRPIAGNKRARCSLDSSVPNEFMVMFNVRRSASKARIRDMISLVGEGRVWQNA